MSRLVTSAFELNSAASAIGVDVATGSNISVVTTTVKAGVYSCRFNPTSSVEKLQYSVFSSNQTTTIFTKMWINITVYPTVTTRLIGIYSSATALRSAMLLTTTGVLQTTDSSGTTIIGSASSPLNLNTWYCIEMSHDTSTTTGVVTARVNGVQFTSAAGSMASAGWGQVIIGAITPSTTATFYVDDFVINDSTGSAQNTFPGLTNIVRATPAAAGDSNTFAQAVGGTAGSANNFTRVQELTPDGSSSFNADPALGHSDLFTVSIPSIPAGSTINGVFVGGQYANRTAADATAALEFQAEKASSGTIAVSSPIIPNTTVMKINQVSPASATSVGSHPLALYNDPDGSPWTPVTVASMQIGYVVSAANVSPVSVSNVYALIDYTPPANTSNLLAFM